MNHFSSSVETFSCVFLNHGMPLSICGPYPIHRQAQLAFKKKEKYFRVLGKSVPKRNGFFWSPHLLFIFIYYGGNQVRTKTPNDSSQEETV